jgi:hypothetical protein
MKNYKSLTEADAATRTSETQSSLTAQGGLRQAVSQVIECSLSVQWLYIYFSIQILELR